MFFKSLQMHKRISILFSLTVLFLCSLPASAAEVVNSKLNNAKAYTFAACIMYNYRGTPLADEADVWASVEMERGSLFIGNYADLADLVRSVTTPERTQSGISLPLKRCYEFVNSNEILDKIKKITKTQHD